MGIKLVIKEARLSYCYAMEGKVNRNSGKRDWPVTVIIPKDDPQVAAIKEAIAAAKVDGAEKLGKGGGIKNPLLDGDAKEDGEYKYQDEAARGSYFIRTSNKKFAPPVVDASKQPIINPNDLYSGCYANVYLDFYAYTADEGKSKGITTDLLAIQKVREGERLSGSAPVDVNSVFGDVSADFLA